MFQQARSLFTWARDRRRSEDFSSSWCSGAGSFAPDARVVPGIRCLTRRRKFPRRNRRAARKLHERNGLSGVRPASGGLFLEEAQALGNGGSSGPGAVGQGGGRGAPGSPGGTLCRSEAAGGVSSLSRSGEVDARSAGRSSEAVWKVRLGWESHDASPEGGRLIAQGVSPGKPEVKTHGAPQGRQTPSVAGTLGVCRPCGALERVDAPPQG